MNEDERKRLEIVAYHEAGHAVVAIVREVPFKRVSIVPDDDSEGHVEFTDQITGIMRRSKGEVEDFQTLRDRDMLEKSIQVCLAGDEAVRKHGGQLAPEEWEADRQHAYQFVDQLYAGEAWQAYYDLQRIVTRNLFTWDHIWAAVESLAAELLKDKKGVISSRRARRIVNQAIAEVIGIPPVDPGMKAKKLTREQRQELRNHPWVRQMMEEERSRRY